MKNKKLVIGIIVLVLLGGVIWWSNKKPNPSPVEVSNQSDQQKLYPESEITHGHGLAVDVTDSAKVYIATHHGLLVLVNDADLYRVGTSNDGGENWQSTEADLASESPMFIAYDRQNPETVYLLTEKNSVYKSNDSGELWNKVR